MKKTVCLLIVVIVNITGSFVQISNGEIISKLFSPKLTSSEIFQDRNSITGYIFNESRNPVSDIHVELLTDLYVTAFRTRTNGSGMYSFRGLPDGNYRIKVIPYNLGYEEAVRDVSLISVSRVPGGGSISEQVDIYLKTKKNVNSGPFGISGVLFAQEVPPAAKKSYEEGINLLNDKKEKEGFEKLKAALEIFPNYYLALDRLGSEYVVRGYYEASLILLTKSVEINPRSFSSNFGLGLSQFRLKQIDKAVESFLKATEINQEYANAFLWLGIALHDSGKLDEAVNSFLKADKLSKGESAEVHWQMARVYKDKKLYGKAADELELFLKFKPEAANKEEIKKTVQILRQKVSNN